MPEIHINSDGVTKLLSNFKENKALGPEGITPVILKMFATILAPSLTHIFNKTLTSGTLPSDWLTANISSIYKKGDRTAAANYRPVSLTPICCKVLEHILHSNIMQHLDKHKILTDNMDFAHTTHVKHTLYKQYTTLHNHWTDGRLWT